MGQGVHDDARESYGGRGLRGYSSSSTYDITGFATGGTNGSTTTAATPYAKNVAATIITPNSDATKAMTTGFNAIYQVTSVTGPNGATASVGYDANARPASTTGPNGAYTTFAYDDVNRTKTATTGSGWVKTYLYEGNTTKVTSPASKWKKHEVDVAGNLIKVTEPNPAGGADLVTDYTYNEKNQLITVTMVRSSG